MIVTLLEIVGYDIAAGSEKTLYFCDNPISPFPGGDVDRPNQYYEPRIADLGGFSKSMFSAGRTSGRSASNAGSISLANADGGLDYLKDWGFSGRRVTVCRGAMDDAFNAYAAVLSGTVKQRNFNYDSKSASSLDFIVADRADEFNAPIQTTLYAGTNSGPTGDEGAADDIKGQPKPLCFGLCYNVTPAKCNTSALRYQVHDGAINAVLAVYDGGVPLAYNATPGPGQYSTDLSSGIITLGGSPSSDVTADIEGAAPGGSYLTSVADIVAHIAIHHGNIAAGDIDSAAFAALNAANSSAVGIYINAQRNINDVLDELLASIGGYWTFDRTGKLSVGRFEAPSGAADYEITDVENIEIALLQSSDDDRGVPAWRVVLDYKKNYTIQNASQLAGSVSDARRAELEIEYRTATADDATVKTAHLLAPEIRRATLLTGSGAAATEASRLLDLYKVRRDFYRIAVPTEEYPQINLGDVVNLKMSRFYLSGGKKFIVIAVNTDTPLPNQTQIEVWG